MLRHTSSLAFALASLLPGLCLLAGSVIGGVWSAAGLIAMTLIVFLCDRAGLAARAGPGLSDRLPFLIALLHFAVLISVLAVLARPHHLTPAQTAALLLGTALFFGQVSNACAHELIHRQSRVARRIGAAMFVSLLNGQHVSAHLLVHHVHAATVGDPNSAAAGQGFWNFAAQAFSGGFTEGLAAESRRRRNGEIHAYWFWLSGAALALTMAAALTGLSGVAALLGLGLYAQIQLLLSDYLQHYGLRRRQLADGRYEPMGPQHSWNAPHPWSAALMLNAPLHSDHHVHPGRPFDRLSLDRARGPVLPRSVPVMGAVALIPPLWRRMMDPHLRRLTSKPEKAYARCAAAKYSCETLSV